MQGLPSITSIGPDGVASYGDAKVFAEFYRGKRPSPAKSRAQGMPVWDEIDMIRVIIPGERDQPEYEATLEYQRRFPVQWAAYQQGIEQKGSGTPLDLMLLDQPALVASLNAMKIWTVQQLANIGDTAAHNIPFGMDLRKRAQAFLERANERDNEVTSLKAELAKRDERLDAMQADMAKLTALLEERTEPKRGPGRPKAPEPAEVAA